MKFRTALVLGLVVLFGALASAQDYSKIEVTANYSYIHANPQNNDIIPTFSLNGGGGSATFYFNRYIGIEAEFQGYGSFTHNLTIRRGTLRAIARRIVSFLHKATCSPTTLAPS